MTIPIVTTKTRTHLRWGEPTVGTGLYVGNRLSRTACGRAVAGTPGEHVDGDLAGGVSCGTCRSTATYRNALRALNQGEHGEGRTLADLKRGDIVGDQVVLTSVVYPERDAAEGPYIIVGTTGDGHAYLKGKPSDPAPAAGEASPRALAELYLTQAATDLAQAQSRLNALLPKIPEGLTADLGNDTQLYCPKLGCTARLTASAATTERSPVLGWGPSEQYDFNGGNPTAEPVIALWVGDYDYGDGSDPIDSITCWNGHAWRVPDHIDRNV